MRAKVRLESNIVRCCCNDVQSTATFEVAGNDLVLTSPFGVDRVRLGIAEPKRLAKRLLKNICTKATSVPPAAATASTAECAETA